MRDRYLSFNRDDARYVERSLSDKKEEQPQRIHIDRTDEEVAVMIGLYRQGNDFAIIGSFFFLTGEQAEAIINNYLNKVRE